MAFLDGIEKLITEHGSASILRERIALANDKHAALEAKAKVLEAENSDLRQENERLRRDLRKAEEKIGKLEEEMVTRQGQRLERDREIILQLLASSPHLTALQISEPLYTSTAMAEFHLGELYEGTLIDCQGFPDEPLRWHITQEGRRYLAKHDLLPS